MTAPASDPDYFVGRGDRAEIGVDAAALLVVAVDKLAREHSQPLPPVLIEIRNDLAEYVRLSRDATRIHAGRGDQCRTDATQLGASLLELAQSQPDLIDTATAGQMLGKKASSVRKLCERERLASMKIGGRRFIPTAAIENYRNGK